MQQPPPIPPSRVDLPYGRRPRRPFWVVLGLVGLPSREWAIAFAWLSLAAAVGCPVYAVATDRPQWWLGIGMVLAAWWYWEAVRWVDRNDQW